MKKKIMLVFMMLFMVMAPVVVQADMGAPMIIEYDAYINNPNGATLYDGAGGEKIGTIPYNTKITINYEIEVKNVLYGEFEYNDQYSAVKLSDIVVVNEEFKINDKNVINISTENRKGYVLNDKGLDVHSGPAEAYKVIGNIPKDAVLQFVYELKDDISPQWLYVKYKKISGWICILNGSVGMDYNATYDMYYPIDVDINDKNGKKIETISGDTTIKAHTYYTLDPWSRGTVYIKDYRGKSGYAEVGYYIQNVEIKFTQEVNMYSVGDIQKVVGKIPSGEVLISDYNNDYQFFHVTYNGVSGLIDLHDDGLEIDFDIPDPIPNPEPSTSESTEPHKEPTKKGMSSKDFVVLCVGGAVVLALTAGVTIKLVNKKKDDKKEKPVKEKKKQK